MSSKLSLILSMVIFGTIGIFRKYIPVSSAQLAFFRGILGALFLFFVLKIRRKNMNFSDIKNNLTKLIVSGVLIGINWILLFEAYNYTSVAVATLCYYFAPVFVIILSPVFLGEKIKKSKIKYVVLSVLGMVLVSGAVNNSITNISEIKGIIFGLSAALCYCVVIIINKKIHSISAYDKTIIQLFSASVVLIPYILLTQKIGVDIFTPSVITLIIVVGIIHTGIAYLLYFGSMEKIKAQTVAVFSYIDPITSIILSAFILNESLDIFQIIGAVLVLGSTLLSELREAHS